jgi:hypothetical protein
MGRIGTNRFVEALGSLATHAPNLADVAQRFGVAEGDLRMFLDEHSDTGLTEEGHRVLKRSTANCFERRRRTSRCGSR